MWLRDNARSLIAVLFTVGVLTVYILMLRFPVKTDSNVTQNIVTSLTNMQVFILGYYFGSMKESSKKSSDMDESSKKTTLTSEEIVSESKP